MEEIEVGEYVRLSRNQGINKIIEIEDDRYILENEIADEYGNATCVLEKDMYEEEILKHSKDVIDLIEVEDYVNGERIQDLIGDFIETNESLYNRCYLKNNIKSIVTKEQYKNAEYIV